MTETPARTLPLLWLSFAAASLVLCGAVDLVYFPPYTIFPDEQRFVASAVRLAASGEFWVGTDRAWEMPGTAVVFAAFIKLFGGIEAAIRPIRLFQAILVVVQALLVGITAKRLFDAKAGLAAFVLAAFYPFFLFYQGLLLSETLFNGLLVAGFACLYWWRERGARLDFVFVLTCLCFGLATYVKATLTVLPPLLIGAAMLGVRRPAAIVRLFLLAALLHAAMLSPWWLRNYKVLDAFVPFTTFASYNLYLGNNPNNPHVGIDGSDTEPAVMERIMPLPEVARQRAFTAQALAYIRAEPGTFVHRMGLKFVRFWNVVPNAASYRGAAYRLLTAASFGPVLVLSIVGLVLWRRRLIALMPIVALVGYFTLLHMATIASLRYRLPLEPFLIVLAGGALSALGARRSAPKPR